MQAWASICKHEQAWASMSKHAQAWARMLNQLILTGLTSNPLFRPSYCFFNIMRPMVAKKQHVSTHEQAWASISKNVKYVDFNRFNNKIPYFGPSHTYLTLYLFWSLTLYCWREKASETPFLPKSAFFIISESSKAPFVICKKSLQNMTSNFRQQAILNLSSIHVMLVQSLLVLFSNLFKWHET